MVGCARTTEQNLVASLHAFNAKNLLPGSSKPKGDFASSHAVLAAIKTARMTDLYPHAHADGYGRPGPPTLAPRMPSVRWS